MLPTLMQIKTLTTQNIMDEHICCAFSDKKCTEGYQRKKDWLLTEYANGYRFQKMDVRGKVFIEYVPLNAAWLPLTDGNFMVINCFWVAGKFKGQGNAKRLFNQCLNDAQGMDGIVAISSDKKRPFMSDPKFFKHLGFEIIDEAPPYFKLWGLKTNPSATFPKIRQSAKLGKSPDKDGITAYYSNTCPFTEFHINHNLRTYAKKHNIPIKIHHLKTRAQAQNMPIPWIINSVFYQGELVTLEMKPDRHLDKLIKA